MSRHLHHVHFGICSLLICILLFASAEAQVRGTVHYLSGGMAEAAEGEVDTGEVVAVDRTLHISGYLSMPDTGSVLVESVDGPRLIRRSEITQVDVIRPATHSMGIAGGLTVAYAAGTLITLDRYDEGGLLGVSHFLPEEYSDRGGWILLGGFGGTVLTTAIMTILDTHTDQRITFRGDDAGWRKLQRYLDPDRGAWRFAVSGGYMASRPKSALQGHQTRNAVESESDHGVAFEWYDEGLPFQWLRSIEVTRRVYPALSVGTGLYDLSLGEKLTFIEINDDAFWCITNVSGSGIGPVISWQPLRESLPDYLDLRLGGSFGPAHFLVREEVKGGLDSRGSGGETTYHTFRPFAQIHAELTLNFGNRFWTGLRADAVTTFSSTRPDPGVAGLAPDEEGIGLATSVVGFMIGYGL